MNDTVISVCLIIITVSLVLLIGAMIYMLIEVRRLSKGAEKLLTHMERGVTPVLTMLGRVSEDISCVTETVRLQAVRVDQTADHLSKSLVGLVQTCTKTGYLLHDALAEPLVEAAALLKGLSRGVTFFLSNRKR